MELVLKNMEDYAREHTKSAGSLLEEIESFTVKNRKDANMLTGRVEGRLLNLLARLSNAKRILEIGMFTGYSALSMAEALPDEGELVTCDMDPEIIRIAQNYFDRSPHGKKIKIMPGNALQSLLQLKGPFDLAFIDADKENYPVYYEKVLPLVRSGGLMIFDNALWDGTVLNPVEASDIGVSSLNELINVDDRVENVLLTVRDGINIVRKR